MELATASPSFGGQGAGSMEQGAGQRWVNGGKENAELKSKQSPRRLRPMAKKETKRTKSGKGKRRTLNIEQPALSGVEWAEHRIKIQTVASATSSNGEEGSMEREGENAER